MAEELLRPPEFADDGSFFSVTLRLGGAVTARERAWVRSLVQEGRLDGRAAVVVVGVARDGSITNGEVRSVLNVDSVEARSQLQSMVAARLVAQLVHPAGKPARGHRDRWHAGRVMTRFFTADLHLGHRNIIEYCSRPFLDVDEMNGALVDRWNETVGDQDEVIVLGDVAMGRISETLPLVGSLRGRKVLLAGNHDRCWRGHHKGVEAATARYLDAGFDEIWQGQVELRLGGKGVLACHFPYRGDSHDHDRYVEYRPADRGAWLLHGHVHERWRSWGRMINVGVDVWDYRPVADHELADLVR